MSAERFHVAARPLEGLAVLERRPLGDDRGFFERVFCAEAFTALGVATPIAQINQSCTRSRGAVRGMHFQVPPHAETKFVSCLAGEVFDVAIDLRRGSPTFLRYHGEVLSAANHRSMLIPPGFAHGFQALSDDCLLLYLHTAPYVQQSESGLHALDPAVKIKWPLPVAELSARDQAWPQNAASFVGIAV